MESSMPPNIRDHLKNQEEPLVEAIKTLVRIPSVLDEEATDFPFGKGIDDALREALKIAKGLGFQTKYDPDGYFGTAEVGQGDELVGLLGHMDVVPPGNLDAWETGPFEPFEKDGVMYGRGVQDDKGPALASLFAIKALMDAGVIFNKRVRFIFSTDEETLWRGINKYLEKGEEVPTIGFSPDANFPLIYAEKGLLDFLTSRIQSMQHFHMGTYRRFFSQTDVGDTCIISPKKVIDIVNSRIITTYLLRLSES